MSSSEETLTPKAVIARIRRKEYLLDVEASYEIQEGIQSLHRNLNHALRILAEDLNKKDTHFILELVQNADDNDYLKGVIPKLSFQLSSDRLVVSNNETGFTEENVIALCRVGQSSKAKKEGFIGEKGIGFKSVFAVSNAPEIHSNGYHFRFDRIGTDSLLGYVVPHWHEPAPPVDESVTTIVLPVQPGKGLGESKLEDLESQLLLFLGKVRELELKTEMGTMCHIRTDEGSLTSLKSTLRPRQGDVQVKSSRYARYVSELAMEGVTDEKRDGVKTTKLVLAFPVSETGDAAPEIGSQTFAFLPIRAFGFNFCIQADFILSASREDIHTDRPWNLRLRESIAGAFVEALETFKETPALAFTYLKYLPSEGDITDKFFKPVVTQLIAQLSRTSCIPSGSGAWRKPSEILLAGKTFQTLFPSTDAQKLFGLDYPNRQLVAGDPVLTRIGCRHLTYIDILSIFKKHGEWLSGKTKDWLAAFYAHLAQYDHDALVKHGILSLPCIPTSDGTFAIPEKGSVFYPLSHRKKYGFEHELTIIDYELFEKASALSDKVGAFFEKLHVKKDNPFELVKSHILEKHADDAWMSSDNEALIGHLRYIKDKLNEYLSGAAQQGHTEDQAIALLRNGLWMGTQRKEGEEWGFDRATNLYLATEYQPEFDIESLLGAALAPGKLVATDYLPRRPKKVDEEKVAAEAAIWRAILKRLGVFEVPKVERLPDGDTKCSAEMETLLDSPQYSIRRAVLECIDRNWAQYSDHVTFSVRVGRSMETRFTQFANALRAMLAPTRKRVNVRLAAAYLRTPEIIELFGESLVYVDAKISTEVLRIACGVTYRVNADACIKRLVQLKTEGGDTTPQLKRIYRQLEQLWDKDRAKIKEAFSKQALIRIKGERVVWASPEEVSWRKSGPFLDSLYPPLYGQYLDFSNFFVDKLGVSKELSITKMVAALPKLAEMEPANERAGEALRIYRNANSDLASRAKQGQSGEPDWLDTFRVQDVFITRTGQFVANDETLYVDDLPEIGALFGDVDDISILAIPPDEIPRLWRLFDAVEIQYLSDSLLVEVVKDQEGVPNIALTSKVRAMYGFIARVLYHKSTEKFEAACAEGLFAQLRNLEIIEVPELQLRVTLNDVTKITQGQIELDGQQVFVKRGTRSLSDRLAPKICKLLHAPDTLADTIGRLLLAEDAEAAEDFLSIKNIVQLPAEEMAAISGVMFDSEGENPHEREQLPEPEESFDQTPQAGADETQVETNTLPPAQESEPAADDNSNALNLSSPNSDRPTKTPPGLTEASAPAIPKKSPPSTAESPTGPGTGIATQKENPLVGETEGPATSPAQAGTSPGSSVSPSTVLGPGSIEHNFARHQSGAHSKRSTKSRKKGAGQSRTKSGRLLSYADAPQNEAHQPQDIDDEIESNEANAIGQAAVDYFLATQQHRWKSLTEMPPNNHGFDVKAIAHDGEEEEIEVKGQSGAWTEAGVALTSMELIHAHRVRSRYWLCVVEFATDENRRQLYLVKDPFGLTRQFRFDSGWKSQAIFESAQVLRPEQGLNIDIPGEGRGVIVSAKSHGPFFKLHVHLEDGRQINKPFNPATMKLSRD